MRYHSVFDIIEERALKEGKTLDEILDLSEHYYTIATERYKASKNSVEKYVAEKLLWKHFGWTERFPGAPPERKDEDIRNNIGTVAILPGSSRIQTQLPLGQQERLSDDAEHRHKHPINSIHTDKKTEQFPSVTLPRNKDENIRSSSSSFAISPSYPRIPSQLPLIHNGRSSNDFALKLINRPNSIELLLLAGAPSRVGLEWPGETKFPYAPVYGQTVEGQPYWSIITHPDAYSKFVGPDRSTLSRFAGTFHLKFTTHLAREHQTLMIWIEAHGPYCNIHDIDKAAWAKLERAYHFLFLWVWAFQVEKLPPGGKEFLEDFMQLEKENKLGKIPPRLQPRRPALPQFEKQLRSLPHSTTGRYRSPTKSHEERHTPRSISRSRKRRRERSESPASYRGSDYYMPSRYRSGRSDRHSSTSPRRRFWSPDHYRPSRHRDSGSTGGRTRSPEESREGADNRESVYHGRGSRRSRSPVHHSLPRQRDKHSEESHESSYRETSEQQRLRLLRERIENEKRILLSKKEEEEERRFRLSPKSEDDDEKLRLAGESERKKWAED
ncbi:hypothetical protein GLAREA_09428 [Glarea lozoyensis ATCC 20868]|uniref:Uncharacterized protein n=1 Tax=Glarea lozoyensis (strain ATCC 20868 / MF5171) TaxID=1116229 RepID=S3DPF1_GLAL2|nr:uncharacterized protein GLAREA_09428 [Glarea lozoyensis ATCC 20868]EPE28308.1 hypothetical protein GLAREA_09428 [Glarea lozoyensis ATCC 20868]